MEVDVNVINWWMFYLVCFIVIIMFKNMVIKKFKKIGRWEINFEKCLGEDLVVNREC